MMGMVGMMGMIRDKECVIIRSPACHQNEQRQHYDAETRRVIIIIGVAFACAGVTRPGIMVILAAVACKRDDSALSLVISEPIVC